MPPNDGYVWRQRQREREAGARQLALGQRARIIEAGHLGPVLRRWVNTDVVPIAALMRTVASVYIAGDMRAVATLLDTPKAELSDRERPLLPLMQWLLRGRSPGRTEFNKDTTHAEDLALSFLATIITRISQDRCTLSAALALSADSLRDTVQGQFISSVQGAPAMQAFRERNAERWKQRKSLNRICARLYAQARPELLRIEREAHLREDEEGNPDGPAGRPLRTRGKKVLYVLSGNEERRLHIRPPDALDWEVMSLCWRDEKNGATQAHRSLWLGLAGMFLAAAQRCSGWFDVAGETSRRRHHTRTTKYLVLSEEAQQHIKRDIERWVSIGFAPQPMIVPPENGDYLTVKHRPVTGQRPPLGLLTSPEGSWQWVEGAMALAESPWTVNPHAISAFDKGVEVGEWANEDTPPVNDIMRVTEHKRLAAEEAFYLPVCMDFRGRIYYRTPWVTPQSSDLGKSLLCFPQEPHVEGRGGWAIFADEIEMHLGNLYGNGMDKAPLSVRSGWLRSFMSGPPGAEDLSKAEKPLQLASAIALLRTNEWDRIPVSLDGTCNGLQHLTALLRDETAAPYVNLTASTLEDAKGDIYGEVARRVEGWLQNQSVVVNQELVDSAPWIARMFSSGVLQVNRDLTKRPVMVLPYGGTLEAIHQAVKASVLSQLAGSSLQGEQLHSSYGRYGPGQGWGDLETPSPWHRVETDGYGAMKDRELKDHPLFNTDCRHLAQLIWECIHPVIPRAMKFMKALQEIGSWLGPRAIAWQTPNLGWSSTETGPPGRASSAPPTASRGTPLWIIQAKSKALKKQVTMRGFHLPDMVRRLTLMSNSNEIDPRSNRTGIVANFIHSLDACHLAGSIAMFKAEGGGCVGAVHDNVWVRPSEAALMGRCLRETFARMYGAGVDPLWQPVKTTLDGETWQEYGSWYSLAEAAGVDLPGRGSWDPEEVKASAWFFS